jgi:hypothetical protein
MKDLTNLRPNWLRLTGFVVLLAGMLVAGLIYRSAAGVDQGDDPLTKGDVYQLEKMGGREVVITTELDSWLASLFQGRRLAGTVALISITVSGLCFIADRRLKEQSAKTAGSGD